MTENPPAGWYPDSEGTMRWWDGSAWTETLQSSHTSTATMPEPPAEQPHNVRAEAAALKAYTKANRPWYKKKRWIGAIIILVVIVLMSLAAGGGSSDGDKSASSTTDNSASDKSKDDKSGSNSGDETDTKTSAYGSAKMPLQNGDWKLESIKVDDDGLGSFGGRARITYTGDDKEGGTNIFTVTLFKGKDDVGTLQGSANTVMPGKTVTVQLISTEDYVKGPYKYDFQNDL